MSLSKGYLVDVKHRLSVFVCVCVCVCVCVDGWVFVCVFRSLNQQVTWVFFKVKQIYSFDEKFNLPEMLKQCTNK
jgi:hypothetical protein